MTPSASSAFRLSVFGFGFRFGRLGRFDETHQDEARNGCGANGDGRTFANKIACLVYQIVDILVRSEEHTSELQSLMRISYAVFCLKKKKHKTDNQHH